MNISCNYCIVFFFTTGLCLTSISPSYCKETFFVRVANSQDGIGNIDTFHKERKEKAAIAQLHRELLQQRERQNFFLKIGLMTVLGVAFYIFMLYRRLMEANRSLNELNKQLLLFGMNKKSEGEKENNIERTRQEQLFQQIVAIVSKKENLTDPHFSIAELTYQVGSNEKYVSQAINQIGKLHFNKFINGFRIHEAKKMLIDQNMAHLSIEQIASACGFGNINGFYKNFREFTGLTPRKFRSMNLKKS